MAGPLTSDPVTLHIECAAMVEASGSGGERAHIWSRLLPTHEDGGQGQGSCWAPPDSAGNIRNGDQQNTIWAKQCQVPDLVCSLRPNQRGATSHAGANLCHDGTLSMEALLIRPTRTRPPNQQKQSQPQKMVSTSMFGRSPFGLLGIDHLRQGQGGTQQRLTCNGRGRATTLADRDAHTPPMRVSRAETGFQSLAQQAARPGSGTASGATPRTSSARQKKKKTAKRTKAATAKTKEPSTSMEVQFRRQLRGTVQHNDTRTMRSIQAL